MRLIDADKLKEYVNSKSTHFLCEWDTAGVLIAIDAQETVEQKWILCSERLPDKNGMYLVTQITHSVSTEKPIATTTEYVEFADGKWRRNKYLKVVAWMPLPEPYKK